MKKTGTIWTHFDKLMISPLRKKMSIKNVDNTCLKKNKFRIRLGDANHAAGVAASCAGALWECVTKNRTE